MLQKNLTAYGVAEHIVPERCTYCRCECQIFAEDPSAARVLSHGHEFRKSCPSPRGRCGGRVGAKSAEIGGDTAADLGRLGFPGNEVGTEFPVRLSGNIGGLFLARSVALMEHLKLHSSHAWKSWIYDEALRPRLSGSDDTSPH